MAVRFLPDPGERPAHGAPDREDLAEVIELRSLLSRRGREAEDRPAGEPGHDGESSAGEAATAPERVGAASEAEEAEELGEAPGSVERPTAKADGVRILARRARSSGELREELLRLDHEPGEVEAVIAEFADSLYLDDLGLARALTEKLRDAKRASRSQIRVKLRERRLPDAVIEEAVGELDAEEEFAILRETAAERARKLGGVDRQTAERRLLGYLARRGWSGEPALRAARDALDGVGGEGRGGCAGGVRFV
ncbi:regulatory protein RecX [Leucobacter massiliensis]|uniref:Regulatory protein RecX n=1 Tax=Leucobacter massiliensis TaxID=1686285 RepID=A0A2S9QMC3_9MICO|nr:regulatory protein RecX [Leucobacter massiliensis]PRI10746.1 hypothetical protein B4915_07545 [Leucobacter massiliensis]